MVHTWRQRVGEPTNACGTMNLAASGFDGLPVSPSWDMPSMAGESVTLPCLRPAGRFAGLWRSFTTGSIRTPSLAWPTRTTVPAPQRCDRGMLMYIPCSWSDRRPLLHSVWISADTRRLLRINGMSNAAGVAD